LSWAGLEILQKPELGSMELDFAQELARALLAKFFPSPGKYGVFVEESPYGSA